MQFNQVGERLIIAVEQDAHIVQRIEHQLRLLKIADELVDDEIFPATALHTRRSICSIWPPVRVGMINEWSDICFGVLTQTVQTH